MLTIYKASAGSGKTYTLAFQYIKLLLAYFEPLESKAQLLGIHGDGEGSEYKPEASSDTASKTGAGKASTGKVSTDDEYAEDEDGNQQYNGQKGHWRLYDANGPRSRHRRILAVTFTHKATEEMKVRIVNELRDIVNTADLPKDKQSDYVKKLLKLTKDPVAKLKETAQKALDDLLYDFHFFNVSTIDSFFQQVLRGFAREVAKNEDFALEIDNTVAVTMGVDSMLNSINTDTSKETESLAGFIEEWMKAEYRAGRIGNMFNRNASIYRKLVKFVASTMNEEFKVDSEAVIDYLKDDPERFKRFHAALNARLEEIPRQTTALAVNALNILETSDKFVQDNLKSSVKTSLEKLAEGTFKLGDNSWTRTSPNYVKDALSDPIEIFNAKYKNKTDVVPQPLCEAIAKTFDAVISGVTEMKWLKAITGLLSHFGVLVSALEFIMQYRQDNNLILLSDTNELLQKVINDQDAPFIYEKLGNILEYYLIDEFQDTSRLQWENLRPLVDNSISQGNENLIIGDEKQSIYRFRNADAELLHRKVKEDIGKENCDIHGDKPGENTNYRSSPAVVRFNNALFKYLGKKVGSMYFGNVVQDIHQSKRNMRGHVRFDIIPATKKADYVDIVLPRLVCDIRSLKARGYTNSQIVVLVRTRDEGNAVVEHLLRQNDPTLAVASDESLKLTMCPSVRVIISALRMFTQQREPDPNASIDSDLEMRINEVEFLNSQGNNLSESIVKVANGNKEEELKKLNSVIDYRSSNLFTLTERIIQDVLSEQMRRKDYSYIMAFQDYVAKFCSQFTSNVRKFLRWWDMNEKKLTVAASPNVEAIRVMTIHKSKGLEFRCVLMPFTDIGVQPREELWLKGECLKGLPNLKVDDDDIPPLLRVQGSSNLDSEECPFYEDYKEWRQNQKTDMLNVGYVAFTRAKTELIGYIKGSPSKVGTDTASATNAVNAVNAAGPTSPTASSGKPKKSKSSSSPTGASAVGASSASEVTPDVVNIGDLLIEAFQKVVPDSENQGIEEGEGEGKVGFDVDELYYCQNPEEKIPMTIPLSPYFGTAKFASVEEYANIDEFSAGPETSKASETSATSEPSTTSASSTTSEPSEENATSEEGEGSDGTPTTTDSFVIQRFEYGKPTIYPALEETPEEKEERENKDEEKKKKRLEEESRFRSPLEKIQVGDYTPTFPKNVEHYFTVDEEEDTYEEAELATDVGDALTEEDGLPGGFGPQQWGEILHRAMSYIHDKSATENAIARVSRQFKMDEQASNFLRNRVYETVGLDHPRVKLWFDRHYHDSVVTERPIYEPTSLVTYRPDRIVWYKDGSADIVDYKFGVQFSEDYNLQMKKYIKLLEDMGVPKVRGYIYFPTYKKIIGFQN